MPSSSPRASSGAQLLLPEVLARIDNLDLLARTVVEGFLNGLHRSIYLGLSLDFAEHRPYMPGDDIRRIDWRLYGRTDRHYIKLFEAETNANFVVLLDVSRSMSFGTHSVTKLEYSKYLAACLTYFSRHQRDRVGLITFDDDVVDHIPPSARNLDLCLHALHRAEANRPGELGKPLLKAIESLRRKGILVLISDFYQDPEDVMAAVRLLKSPGHDVIVFHVLDPAELEFSFEGPSNFQDMETAEEIPLIPAKVRDRYQGLFSDHRDELRERFAAAQVDYALLDTSKPLDHALFHLLLHREKRRRVR
ncbi:MAG: DUF58 domain-containing protein [Gemmatimonadetes bacterium]|nr:DUF58 domain-containing protein [Gemmatimonadota bacterium]NNM06924.1 DUF58 domain-containing protein [Gemmatimonadota bacterium]